MTSAQWYQVELCESIYFLYGNNCYFLNWTEQFETQESEQNGFRSGRSCIDNIFGIGSSNKPLIDINEMTSTFSYYLNTKNENRASDSEVRRTK